VRRLLPALKIHTWGGLGSQLFAVALALDIQKKFPRRKVLIALHTGGVTERLPEVTSLFPGFTFDSIQDFKVVKHEKGKSLPPEKNKFASLRLFVKSFFSVTGLTSTCNTDPEFALLKPWVLSCRGHYSYRTIGLEFLSDLDNRLKASVKNSALHDACAIHYRLGDLITLTEKNPISIDCILSEFRKLEDTSNFQKLVVFSDSPEKANQLFETLNSIELSTPTVSTIEVIANSVEAKFFIGTSSKISFWISGIRAQVRSMPSLLPISNFEQYRGLVGEKSYHISTYQISE
jgi:hypothetical protein